MKPAQAYRISLLFPLLSVFLIVVPVFGLVLLVSMMYWLPPYAVFALLAFFWIEGRSEGTLKLGALLAPWLIAALVGGWVFLLSLISRDPAWYLSQIPGMTRIAVVAGYAYVAVAMAFVAVKGHGSRRSDMLSRRDVVRERE